jgi:uncharacterized protein (DUF1800 family)
MTSLRIRLVTAAMAAVAFGGPAANAQTARELTAAEQAVHALSRLTFGARPGDLQRVKSLGVDRWIEQQLRPSAIRDDSVEAALATLRPWVLSQSALYAAAAANQPNGIMMAGGEMMMPAGEAAGARRPAPISFTGPTSELTIGKVVRAQLSERQLEEMMVDFWLNHFSVFSDKMPSLDAIVSYEREVVRPNALGKFRDLLGAVAHSPAMLFYLDNHSSRSDTSHRTLTELANGSTPASRPANVRALGINENYARELLELHTLGVDGGYTQRDVVEVARALTGWSIGTGDGQPRRANAPLRFVFFEDRHDAEEKTVLGHILPAGRGVEEGEQVLDIVARHPSTARFIATKLARRFISDEPPTAVIDRAAATFTRTDGDIAEVVRTIVTSPEFFSRAAFRSKVKSPFEFLVSVRRALGAPADTTPATARAIAALGQPIFGKLTPEGWPDQGSAWMNAFAMFDRLALVDDATAGKLKYLPTARWDGWRTLGNAPLDRQVAGVIDHFLGGVADKPTRDLMLATATPSVVSPGGTPSASRLRELIRVAMAAPAFQRR